MSNNYRKYVFSFIVVSFILISMIIVPSRVEAGLIEHVEEPEFNLGPIWYPKYGTTVPVDQYYKAEPSGDETEVRGLYEYQNPSLFELKNGIQLMAYVVDITSKDGQEETQVDILLTAVSTSEWDYEDFWGATPPASGGLHATVFTAEQTAGSDSDMKMEFRESHSSGQNYTEDPGDSQIEDVQGALAWWATQTMVSASIPVPGVMEAFEVIDMYFDEGYTHQKKYAIGDGICTLKFHAKQFADRDGVDESDMSYHTASTKLVWEIPYDEWSCDSGISENTIKISAKNVMRNTHHKLGFPNTNTENGAETSISITIRKCEIQSIDSDGIDSGTVTLSAPDGYTYWWDDFTVKVDRPHETWPGGSGWYLEPLTIPKINLIVDWGDGTTDTVQNWEPYRYVQSAWGFYVIADNVLCLDNCYVLTVNPGQSQTFNVEITATVHPEYGGWTATEGYSVTISYPSPPPPPPPPGGCPYVSVWNGTGYQHDNNILIASEHQEGVVDDNYILRNTMVPKDGFYSLKIEEFEYTEDFFDTFSLYTMDHREGYSVGTTPDGEYRTFKDPVPPESVYDCTGNDVLDYVSAPDGNSLFMEENSTIVLNYGDIGNTAWVHQKLVVRSYGFESYTEPSTQGLDMDAGLGGISPMWWWPPGQKTSLYISIRADGSDWTNVTVLHPRNHPSDMVIPLGDVLHQYVPGGIGELEVKILSTKNHSVDFVGLDNSVPTPVRVQKASMVSAMLNGVEDVTDILLEGNDEMVSIVPGEYIILTFEIPRQRPGRAFAVRDYMLFSRGYYQLYEGG